MPKSPGRAATWATFQGAKPSAKASEYSNTALGARREGPFGRAYWSVFVCLIYLTSNTVDASRCNKTGQYADGTVSNMYSNNAFLYHT